MPFSPRTLLGMGTAGRPPTAHRLFEACETVDAERPWLTPKARALRTRIVFEAGLPPDVTRWAGNYEGAIQADMDAARSVQRLLTS